MEIMDDLTGLEAEFKEILDFYFYGSPLVIDDDPCDGECRCLVGGWFVEERPVQPPVPFWR